MVCGLEKRWSAAARAIRLRPNGGKLEDCGPQKGMLAMGVASDWATQAMGIAPPTPSPRPPPPCRVMTDEWHMTRVTQMLHKQVTH